jgi:hypothetical protein
MVEIIQQWQFLGRVHPILLKEEILKKCRECGITSLQSYVAWSEIEKEEGKFDFSAYDELVEKLKGNGLKWVPFLIMGPDYATPEWFHKSKDCLYAKCLEHRKESRIQSIWNSNLLKYRDRFFERFSARYANSGVLESVTFGIGGNWGEALYPVTGGFYKGTHTHLGYWCGDEKAKDSFKGEFPVFKKVDNLKNLIINFGINLPDFIKKPVKYFLKQGNRKTFLVSSKSYSPSKTDSQWSDFSEWYVGEMNRWVDNWMMAARRFFPNTRIYLVTGGTGHPATGADLSKQAKICSGYGAGIRITNQTNDYSQSFILTRLIASACKLYGVDFVTEEAAVLQSAKGVVMRIFDAVSSGAKGIYCKNFISIGGDPCIKKSLPVGEETEGAKVLKDNLHFFNNEKTVVRTAVLFPKDSIFLNPDLVIALYNKCARLRDLIDFDLIDEDMIRDGALNFYQNLLILEGEIKDSETPSLVQKWQGKGHIITRNPEDILGDIDGSSDGIYAVQREKDLIYYNSTDKRLKKNIPFLNKEIELEPNSIKSIII